MDQICSHPVEAFPTCIFVIAVIHTFSTKVFEHLAHSHPRHAGIFHLWWRARSPAAG